MSENTKARVFISCGQNKATDEVEIVEKIARCLAKLGFDPYYATEVHSLQGVTESIFNRLAKSEYFIFIDFKREAIADGKHQGKHRGSLFSHQELAIATFLGIEVLPFREIDTIDRDGILPFIHANCIEFSDRNKLPMLVEQEVKGKLKKREWDVAWRNELSLQAGGFAYVAEVAGEHNPSGFYHIKVMNLHKGKTAGDCIAYVDRIANLSNGKVLIPDLVEFKWAGVSSHRVSIPPMLSRSLDAFHVSASTPNIAKLGINPFIVDSSRFHDTYTLIGPADFELSYVIFSNDFSPARAIFRLHLGNRLEDINFCIKGKEVLSSSVKGTIAGTMSNKQGSQGPEVWASIERYPMNPSGGTINIEAYNPKKRV